MESAHKPIVHSYKVSKELKTYSVYDLTNCNHSILTDTIRIEDYRNKSNARGVSEYLRLRTTTNWSTCEMVTGLRPTKQGVFYGNRLEQSKNKKSLLIFEFSEDRRYLNLYVYDGYYPSNQNILKHIVQSY